MINGARDGTQPYSQNRAVRIFRAHIFSCERSLGSMKYVWAGVYSVRHVPWLDKYLPKRSTDFDNQIQMSW